MARLTPKEFWQEAASWGSYLRSGDAGACLYGFDEKGLVQSEEHRRQCIEYIETECRKAADANVAAGDDPAEQHPKLEAMLEYLRTAPIANSVEKVDLDDFTKGYIEAALFFSNDESDENGGDPLNKNYGIEHIAPETMRRMREDCAKFQAMYGHLVVAENLKRTSEYTVEASAGHDFWHTRNEDGVGFWDGDWADEAGEILDDGSKSFGVFDLYVGDDGFIYGHGGDPNPDPVVEQETPTPG